MLDDPSDRQTVLAFVETMGDLAPPNNCPDTDSLNQYIERTGEFKRHALDVSRVIANSAKL
jgi:hypothetical protein